MTLFRFLAIAAFISSFAGPTQAQSGGAGGGGSNGGSAGSSSGGTGSSVGATGESGGQIDTGGAGSSDGVETGAGTTTDDVDNSGIFTDPNAQTGEFNSGDAAPRAEPRIRDDDFNTSPRVPGEPALPADAGGAGATGGTLEDETGTGAVPDTTSGDRDSTRELNGTAGSRPGR